MNEQHLFDWLDLKRIELRVYRMSNSKYAISLCEESAIHPNITLMNESKDTYDDAIQTFLEWGKKNPCVQIGSSVTRIPENIVFQ